MNLSLRGYIPQLFIHLLFISLVWSITSPALTASAAPARATCAVTVPTGWQPYLVQADDTLSALANQYGVLVEQLVAVNCLPTAEVQASTLLLVPSAVAAVASPPTPAPTPLPTTPPLPTALPTTPPATAVPASTVATPNEAAGEAAPDAVAQPTGAAEPASNLDPQPSAQPTLDSGSPWNRYWFASTLLLVISALGWYLGIGQSGSPRRLRGSGFYLLLGYALFILTGFLGGLLASPIVEPAAYFHLPLSLGVLGTLILIPLLVLREVITPWEGRWQLFGRLLNMMLPPLLALFLITVLGKFAEYLN